MPAVTARLSGSRLRIAIALGLAMLIVAAGLLLGAGKPRVAVAASDPIFMQYGDPNGTGNEAWIKGDSFAASHPQWIELSSFSWSVENPTTIGSATGGAGTGKAKFNDFVVTKPVDKTSPQFFHELTIGNHKSLVTIDFTKISGTGTEQTYLEYRMGVVFTTKISWSSGGDQPTESLTMVAGSVGVKTFAFRSDGTPEPTLNQSWCWDVVTNAQGQNC
jgi:type VI secretion system secreted protein Hcp